MEFIWIVVAVVAAIIVAMAIVIGIRRRRSNDYADRLEYRDQPTHSQEGRTAEAARFSDRSGFSAGGSF